MARTLPENEVENTHTHTRTKAASQNRSKMRSALMINDDLSATAKIYRFYLSRGYKNDGYRYSLVIRHVSIITKISRQKQFRQLLNVKAMIAFAWVPVVLTLQYQSVEEEERGKQLFIAEIGPYFFRLLHWCR